MKEKKILQENENAEDKSTMDTNARKHPDDILVNQQNTNTKEEDNTNNISNMNEKEQKNQESEEELKEKIKSLHQQLAELNDKHIRLLAEFDNFKKRSRKEKEDLIKYAGEDIWKSILPIIDDFERAIKENQNTNDIEMVKKGFELIYSKLKHITLQNHLAAIDNLHKEFNVDMMEAVAKVPAPSEEMKGKVIEELEKAYQLHNKIIRYAKVVVGE